MMPLYGFLQGDTIGLLILTNEEERLAVLATKLQSAARVRIAAREAMCVVHNGRVLDPEWTVRQAGIKALDRFDVVEKS